MRPHRVIVIAVAALSSLAAAGPAAAYDSRTCDQKFGAGNVQDVDPIRMDTGSAGGIDLGDGLHWDGAPLGNAVVCWATLGRAAIVGRVYADIHWPSSVSGGMWAEWRRTATGYAVDDTVVDVEGSNAHSEPVDDVVRDVNRVRIELHRDVLANVHGLETLCRGRC